MTGAIIPFHRKGDETSALARFDLIAAELLVEGQAASLSEARLHAILANLRGSRAQLCAVMADQRISSLVGHAQFGELATNVTVVVDQTLAQIDQLIQHAELQLTAN